MDDVFLACHLSFYLLSYSYLTCLLPVKTAFSSLKACWYVQFIFRSLFENFVMGKWLNVKNLNELRLKMKFSIRTRIKWYVWTPTFISYCFWLLVQTGISSTFLLFSNGNLHVFSGRFELCSQVSITLFIDVLRSILILALFSFRCD